MNGINIIGNTSPEINIPTTYFLVPAIYVLTDIKWTLYERGNPILTKKQGSFTFLDKSVGNTYKLVASYTIPSLKTSSYSEINITPKLGPPQITKITWEDCNFKDLSGRQVGYLDTVYLVIQTKNIPYGSTLNITVWEEEFVFTDRNMGTLTAKVGKNGKAEVIFNSTLLKAYQKKLNDMAWFWNDAEHQYYVQVEYSNKMNAIQNKTQLKVKNKLEQLVQPDNVVKPLVVTSNIDIDYGLLKPVRAKFETDYDVCHDIVKDFDDYDNFFVLENDGNYGYHWLGNGLTRTATDLNKPNEIPITVSSNQKLSVTITIESNTETSIQLRLVDPNRNYIFDTTHNHKGKGQSEYKFESDNEPFKDYVRYFSTYYLSLELSSSSTDSAWVPTGGHITIRLYITRNKLLNLDTLLSQSSVGGSVSTILCI